MVLLEVARRDVEVPGLQRTGNVCGGIVEREQCDCLALLEGPPIARLSGIGCTHRTPTPRLAFHDLVGGLVPATYRIGEVGQDIALERTYGESMRLQWKITWPKYALRSPVRGAADAIGPACRI